MRYITEFEIAADVVMMDKNIEKRIEWEKERASMGMMKLILTHIGFDEVPKEDGKRFKMEVQAFSMKDWIEFKKEIHRHIALTFPPGRSSYEMSHFKTLFDRLENIGIEINEQNGKPA